MVQVIYPFKENKYPHGKEKLNSNTFMEYLLIAKNQQQADRYRQLNAIFKKLNSSNIMKLFRVLKQDQKFHMVYEYQKRSLQERLKELQKQQQLAELFVELQNVFETLIKQKLKAQIYLDFMCVDQNNHLKVWIKPDDVQLIIDPSPKVTKQLHDYYETERTRIHLQIQQIFQANELKNKQKQKQSSFQQNNSKNQQNAKTNSPNFVIEGNTLVFINHPQKNKANLSHDSDKNSMKTKTSSNFNQLSHEQRPISKLQNGDKKQPNFSNATQKAPSEAPIDISKLSIAEKVLYYKKLKQNPNHNSSNDNMIIVKDSSTSNASINDISKSSNNDSNIQIKTQMINKHKMKIITSEEVEVEGNSDDDLQKLARQKIAEIHKQRQDRNHHNPKKNKSIQQQKKGSNIVNYGHHQKLLKQLEQNVLQNKNPEKIQAPSQQINCKIVQAKQKARSILQKYGQKLKK